MGCTEFSDTDILSLKPCLALKTSSDVWHCRSIAIRLVLPGNFRWHSIPRLCLPIWDNYYHSPHCLLIWMAAFYLSQIISNFGWNQRRNKIAVDSSQNWKRSEIAKTLSFRSKDNVPVTVHKSTQEGKQRFQISQSYCFYLTMYVFIKVCRI